MRPPPTGPSRRPHGGPSGGLILALLSALSLALPASSWAQATRKAPAPPDLRPLARYVARDNILLYLGTDGLDTQPDAWKKTAAYKLLNETSLGVMLEDMTSQFSAHALGLSPNPKLGGADVVAIVKHLARYGFVFAVNQTTEGAAPAPPSGTLVVRSVVGRDAFGGFGRLMGTLMGTAKTQKLMKSGRYIVVVPVGEVKDGKPAATWAWWVEKETDLVIVIGKGAEDAAMAVMDGKKPNAVDHPVRSELARNEGGFIPIGQFFLDPAAIAKLMPPGGAAADPRTEAAAGLSRSGLTRFDYRWGFQDEALMTITRLKAPRPRRGVISLFEQPPFAKGELPPLPEGIESFTVSSVDFAKTFDNLMASPTSPLKSGLTKLAEDLKSRSRVDLRKDLLAHLAPKFAFYVMPGAAPAAPATPSPASAMVTAAGGPLGGLLGVGQLPRFTLAAEVDDNSAASKTLDNLMLACNKAIRASEAEAAESAPASKPEAGAKGESDAAKARRTPPPVPEFRQTPSNHPTENSYVLNIPSTLARQYPAGFRPTIRLKGKQLIISTTPEAARLALEVKPGQWTPPTDLASAFEQLPKDLTVLGARDPRPSLPEILAGLPGAFQGGVNALIARNQIAAAAEAAAAGHEPPATGPGVAPPAAPVPMLKFSIPMSRLPKPDELRERLFPGLFSVSNDEQEIRIVSRVAFPNIMSPSTVAGFAVAVPAIQSARKARVVGDAPAEVPATTKAGSTGRAKTAAEKKKERDRSFVPKD